MLESEIWSIARIDQGNAVLLRPFNSDVVVPIFIGEAESHAILLGLGDVKVKRPLTCDTLLELSRRVGLYLVRVEVYEIKEDIFHARLLFSGGEYSDSRLLVIESRPSDAIALAVRAKCSVYLAPQVLERAGVPAEIFIEETDKSSLVRGGAAENGNAGGGSAKGDVAGNGTVENGKTPGQRSPEAKQENPLAAKRRRLQAELEQAVGDEAYERAAEIRDLLILLDQQLEQERRKAP
jgi:bifunctional DNase/RNase